MPRNQLTRDQRIHRVCHTLAGALDVTIDEWPDLGAGHAVRHVCLRTAVALNQLGTGDLEAAHLTAVGIGQLVAGLPNGDTTEGAC